MPLRLFNTLTRATEDFQPQSAPRVTLYTCGPTVWNFAHIGNFRTFIFEDVLRRYLEFAGFDVVQVMNLTDVDDRTIKSAHEAGVPLVKHTAPFTAAFHADREYLRIQAATHYPAATEHVPGMIDLVQRLLDKGVAYQGDDGSVYFAIGRFPTYGRLSRIDTRELKTGASARVASDEYAKEDARDFVLWKAAKPEDEAVGAAWDAPFGRGRPGWHLECSAMAREYLGDTIDIHAGGVDLIFPHHEDEIAQSEAANGKPFARVWMHGEFLLIEGTKMSKRYGNFLTARDLHDSGWDASAVRYLFGQTHYRKQLNFTDDALKASSAGAQRLAELQARLGSLAPGSGTLLATLADSLQKDFVDAMDDDLDVPRAIGVIQTFVREANAAIDREGATAEARDAALATFNRVAGVLQIVPGDHAAKGDEHLMEWAKEMAEERKRAKWSKDFQRADEIRKALLAKGIEIRDTKDGAYELKRTRAEASAG